VPANARGVSLVLTSTGATLPGLVITWPVNSPLQLVPHLASRVGVGAANTDVSALGDGLMAVLNFGGTGVVLTGDAYGYYR
jgi:hypothetical protein